MKSRRMRRVRHIAHMGDRGGTNGFWWKNQGYRDHLEDLGLYGRMTSKWVFRLIQIIHKTPDKKEKKITTGENNGL
jgi:hypothetical protein